MRKGLIRCGLIAAWVLAGCGGELGEGGETALGADAPEESPVSAMHVPVTQKDPLSIPLIRSDTMSQTLAMEASFDDPRLGRRRPIIRIPRPRRAPEGSQESTHVALNDLVLDAPLSDKQFAGLGRGFNNVMAFSTLFNYPAPSGDVSDSHYVQVVNNYLAVFDKGEQMPVGTVLLGPLVAQKLWSGTECEDAELADGVVRFDVRARKWIITHRGIGGTSESQRDEPRYALGVVEPASMAGPLSEPRALWENAASYYQCVAVSETDNPTGRYHRYIYQFDGFNDAPKLGIGSDAYYLTTTMYRRHDQGVPRSARVCALERDKMLEGRRAQMVCFDVATHTKHYVDLLPADLDGEMAPPLGSPHYVFSLRQTRPKSNKTESGLHPLYNRLAVWRFDVDWGQPEESTLFGPFELRVDSFEQEFEVRQRGSSRRLDPLGNRLTGRAPYRNFGDHQAILLTHAIPRLVGGTVVGSGLRWYELRLDANTSSGWPSIYQQGTYAPDSYFRWMGSIAFDKEGNIALGYSIARSTTLYPSLRYTGRTKNCPRDTMAAEEKTLMGGGAAQQRTSTWGTSSSLNIDPVDGCTFWFTSQYMRRGAASQREWSTHIGAFKLPGCDGSGPPPACDVP